jgi:lathosterol oxidase
MNEKLTINLDPSHMDVVLDFADRFILDDVYRKIPLTADWSQDFWLRQSVSLLSIVAFYGYVFYFGFASVSYFFFYDKEQEKHPKFLKHQIRQEIFMSMDGFLPISLMTLPWFLGEVRGYSQLYTNISDYGWPYMIFSIALFLFFTDMLIYWIHRWLHHPILYGRLHKVCILYVAYAELIINVCTM